MQDREGGAQRRVSKTHTLVVWLGSRQLQDSRGGGAAQGGVANTHLCGVARQLCVAGQVFFGGGEGGSKRRVKHITLWRGKAARELQLSGVDSHGDVSDIASANIPRFLCCYLLPAVC